MKNLLFFLILSPALLFGQIGFINQYDESIPKSAHFEDIVVDNDTIVMYSLALDDSLKQGIRFTKFDSLGNILKERIYVDSASTLTSRLFKEKIIHTQDDGYAIMGGADNYVYFLKVNHELELDILVKFPLSEGEQMGNATLIETYDGYILVGDYIKDGDQDILLIKIDKQGNEKWRKILGVPDETDAAVGITKIEGGFALFGAVNENTLGTVQQSTYSKALILTIDEEGNEKNRWVGLKKPKEAGFLEGIRQSDKGWIMIGGTWEWDFAYGNYHSRPAVYRVDKTNKIVWRKVLGDILGSSIQRFTSILPTNDGNYLASGNLWEGSYSRAFHYKFNAHGDSIWMRTDSIYDGVTYLKGSGLLSSGSIMSIGYGEKSGVGVFGFLMKLGPDGCLDILNCWPVSTEVLLKKDLITFSPNPFMDQLSVTIGKPMDVGFLYLYDVMGRFLRKQRIVEGRNEVRVNNLPKGMLFYEIRSKDEFYRVGRLFRQ